MTYFFLFFKHQLTDVFNEIYWRIYCAPTPQK